MRARLKTSSLLAGAVGLGMILSSAAGAGSDSRTGAGNANVTVNRSGGLRDVSVPVRGIRTYGKGAERLDLPGTVTATPGGGSGTASSGPGIDVTRKISAASMAGSVTAFAVSPDGTTAVYIADQITVGTFELFSVPVDGSATPTRISAGLPFDPGENGVRAFQITPDSANVVFLADPAVAGDDELFSVPIDRSTAAVKLNVPTQRPLTAFGISPDGTKAAYFGSGSGSTELYVATIGDVQSGVQVSAGSPQGDVEFADFTPDGARMVFRALHSGVSQWFGVPIAPPGSSVQLSNALGAVIEVGAVSLNGATFVYAADELASGVLDVFSKPVAGGTATKLNAVMAGSGATFVTVSPDGTRVGYLADQNTAGVQEVYSALIGSAGSGTRINAPLSGTQTADTLNVSPDSSMLLYEADQNVAGTFELFSAPIAGGASITLHGLTAPDDAGFFGDLGTPIIGSRAVYPVFGATVDVFSVPFDGSSPFTQVSGAMGSGNTLKSAFLPSVATRLMAYATGPDTQTLTSKVFSVPVRGDLAPEQFNVTAADGTLGVRGYEITADEAYGVYLQDRDTVGKLELYSRELDSDGDTVINVSDNCPYAANMSQAAVVFGQTVTAASKTVFVWNQATEARFVRGPLTQVGTYATDDSGTLVDAKSLVDTTTPASGEGLYYLFAPDCPGRSYQSVLGEEPDRDLATFP